MHHIQLRKKQWETVIDTKVREAAKFQKWCDIIETQSVYALVQEKTLYRVRGKTESESLQALTGQRQSVDKALDVLW